MNKIWSVLYLSFGLVFISHSVFAQNSAKVFTYFGMCDGSTASAIDDKTFIVASDETKFIKPPLKKGKNVLNVYEIGNPNPKYSIDLEATLNTKKEDNEADIEGSAKIGNRIFWITSHALNKNGKNRPDRLNFFATDIIDGKVVLAGKDGQVLTAYKNLLDDLMADERYEKFGFAELFADKIAPEMGGVNIEGLASTPDGKLLIAFRSPIFENQAILAVLTNPNEVIEGGTANFEDPIQLGLEGLGIRDIAYWEKEKSYLIIAGSIADSNEFFLYKWDGQTSNPSEKLRNVDFTGLNPESITIFPNNSVMILSDDGGLMKSDKNGNQAENKTLPDAKRTFRSVSLNSNFLLEQ